MRLTDAELREILEEPCAAGPCAAAAMAEELVRLRGLAVQAQGLSQMLTALREPLFRLPERYRRQMLGLHWIDTALNDFERMWKAMGEDHGETDVD